MSWEDILKSKYSIRNVRAARKARIQAEKDEKKRKEEEEEKEYLESLPIEECDRCKTKFKWDGDQPKYCNDCYDKWQEEQEEAEWI